LPHKTPTPWQYLNEDDYGSGDLHAGTTTLHLALGGYVPHLRHADAHVDDLVRHLLDAGADPDAADGMGFTPMLLGADGPGVVAPLLAAGADPNLIALKWSPLISVIQKATGEDRLEGIRLLLAAGADVNARTREGTALSVAAGGYSEAVVRLLLDAGADPNQP